MIFNFLCHCGYLLTITFGADDGSVSSISEKGKYDDDADYIKIADAD